MTEEQKQKCVELVKRISKAATPESDITYDARLFVTLARAILQSPDPRDEVVEAAIALHRTWKSDRSPTPVLHLFEAVERYEAAKAGR